jgi:hypothetical protein
MILKSISARFDRGTVLFDEEVNIPQHARLLVTVLEDPDTEREEFLTASSSAFADGFTDDEVEYSEDDLR